MKTAIAIRHLHFEDLGTMGPLLAARGYAVRYLDATTEDWCTADAVAADLLVVLGGPIGAFDDALYPFLADELAVISERLQSRRPLLGICLGAQLIARALGAGVSGMGGQGNRLRAPGAGSGRQGVTAGSAERCAGAALAWRPLRGSRRGHAAGGHARLRQPGVRRGAPCAGAAVPSGGGPAPHRALAGRPCLRTGTGRHRPARIARRSPGPAIRLAAGGTRSVCFLAGWDRGRSTRSCGMNPAPSLRHRDRWLRFHPWCSATHRITRRCRAVHWS